MLNLALFPALFFSPSSSLFLFLIVLHLLLFLLGVTRELFSFLLLFQTAYQRAIYFLFITLWLFFTALPSTYKDCLVHHLAVPQWWIQKNTLYEIPWHEWSYYPMLLQLGFAGLMKFSLSQFLSFYHGIFLFLLAAEIQKFLSEEGASEHTQRVGVFLTLTTPLFFFLATTPMVDLAVAYVGILSLRLGRNVVQHPIWWGISIGILASLKPNGILAAGIFFVTTFCGHYKQEKEALLKLLLAGMLAMATFSPWAIKNASFGKHPLYPMTGKSAFSTEMYAPKRPSPLEERRLLYGETTVELFALPLRIMIEGKDGDPQGFDGVLTPLFLLAYIPPFLVNKRKGLTSLWGAQTAYLVASLFLGPTRVRYLSPIFGSFLLLSTIMLAEIKASAIMIAALLLHSFYFGQELVQLPWKLGKEYWSGGITKEVFVEKMVPEGKIAHYANEHLSSMDKIYLLYTGNKFSLFESQTFSGGYFSETPLVNWIRQSPTEEALSHRIKEEGITHLLLHQKRTVKELPLLLTSQELTRWDTLVNKFCTLQRKEGEFILFQCNK